MSNFVYAQEAVDGKPPEGDAEGLGPTGLFDFNSPILMIAVIFMAMYFLILAPNKKRDKERKAMLAAVAKHDRVVTTGGLCGTVVGVTDRTVVLRVSDDDNVKIEFLRGAIAQVEPKDSDKS